MSFRVRASRSCRALTANPLQLLLGLFGLGTPTAHRPSLPTFDRNRDQPDDHAPTLAERLYRLGLPRNTPVHLTRNRTVMLSWHATRGLRLHSGYAAAPDDVLRAVVRFVSRRVPRVERLAARATFMAFPVHEYGPARAARPRRSRPLSAADQKVIDRLVQEHAAFNAKYFGGELGDILITLSNRMRRRLGELRAAPGGAPVEIVLSRRHIARDGWTLALDTLLHEMVHQWQAENGLPLDHGREFRRKARAVGIIPRAVADLTR